MLNLPMKLVSVVPYNRCALCMDKYSITEEDDKLGHAQRRVVRYG